MAAESLNASSAVLVALSGFFIVFIVLTGLSVLIRVISKAVHMLSPSKAAMAGSAPAAQAPGTQAASTPAAASAPQQVELIGVDDLTAACIMAVVSHETGIHLSELAFKRIKAL